MGVPFSAGTGFAGDDVSNSADNGTMVWISISSIGVVTISALSTCEGDSLPALALAEPFEVLA